MLKKLKINLDKFLISLLSVESLGPLLSKVAQTTPIIYFFALLGFPFFVKKIQYTKIFKLLLLFLLYTSLVTIIFCFFEFTKADSKIFENRISTSIRQGSSLILGLILFLVLRSIVKRVSLEVFLRYCIYSIFPIAIWMFFETLLFWGDVNHRGKAYFSEPSHLADFLIQILLGSIFIYFKIPNKKISNKALLFITLLILLIMITTSSGTGFIKLILVIVGILLFEKSKIIRLALIGISAISIVAITAFFLSIENNYLVNVVIASTSSESAETTASFVDRYYSFIGPMSSIFKSLISIGYGFGGDNIYYKDFYPANLIEVVQTVKVQDFGIVSLWGKVLVFAGLPGLYIWILIIKNVFSTIKANPILRNILPVLFSIYLTNFIGSGAFLFIQHWYWLAVVDAQNVSAD